MSCSIVPAAGRYLCLGAEYCDGPIPRTLAEGVGVLTLLGLEIKRCQGVRRTHSLPGKPDFRPLEDTSQCRSIRKPRVAGSNIAGDRVNGVNL